MTLRACTCGTCRFFVHDFGNEGTCRKNPPVPFGPVLSRFPTVKDMSHCFCWEAQEITCAGAPDPEPEPADKPKRGRPRKGSA